MREREKRERGRNGIGERSLMQSNIISLLLFHDCKSGWYILSLSLSLLLLLFLLFLLLLLIKQKNLPFRKFSLKYITLSLFHCSYFSPLILPLQHLEPKYQRERNWKERKKREKGIKKRERRERERKELNGKGRERERERESLKFRSIYVHGTSLKFLHFSLSLSLFPFSHWISSLFCSFTFITMRRNEKWERERKREKKREGERRERKTKEGNRGIIIKVPERDQNHVFFFPFFLSLIHGALPFLSFESSLSV